MQESDITVIFEAVSGSRLYGTSVAGSDYDYRGVGLPPFTAIIGVQKCHQLESKEPDRTIFMLSKFFQLASQCNPNIIELLFIPEKHYITSSLIWERITQNKELFLSTKAGHTFMGYAFSQLKRIKNHKKWIDNPPVKPDRKEMGLSIESKIRFDVLEAVNSVPDSFLNEGLGEEVRQELKYKQQKTEWDRYKNWLETRNPARFALEQEFGWDLKHGMHLVRLIRQGKELLETGTMHVDRRGIDADELLSIRNGAWTYEQVIQYAESMEEEFKILRESSPLPYQADFKGINNLLIDIYCEFYGLDKERLFA